MPELPEVETTRRGIEPHILGRQVADIIIRQGSLRWPVDASLPARLAGQEITAVRRRAKYLLIDIASGSLVIHLGMSGSLRIVAASEPPRFHDHVDIVLNDGKALRFHDPRRFGAILWQEKNAVPIAQLAKLGPEPLLDVFDGKRLYDMSRGRKVPVKTFIMDNAVVVGVGNIYANEALFMAAIRPTAMAGRISLNRYNRLAATIKQVLAAAIEQGGTTLRDFVGGDGEPGYFKQQLNVYGRGGQSCRVCKTILKEVRLGQRSTVYCGQCQR